MDARGAIAVAERQSYIGRIRDLCKAVALAHVEAG
jgi:glycyl-tRNA synthetase alpha chain